MFSKAKNTQDGGAALVEIDDTAEAQQAQKKPRPDARSARLSAPASRKGNGKGGASVPSLISSDVVINGSIEAEGEVQFDGALEGDITAKGLVVGEGAIIHGEVRAEKARISGTVEGTVRAARVDLAASAVVKGEIVHTALSIENGARFEGTCRHSDDPLNDDGTSRKAAPAQPAPQSSHQPASPAASQPAPQSGPRTTAAGAEEMPQHASTPQPGPAVEAANEHGQDDDETGSAAASLDVQEAPAEKKKAAPILKSVPNPNRDSTSTASFLNRGGKTDLR